MDEEDKKLRCSEEEALKLMRPLFLSTKKSINKLVKSMERIKKDSKDMSG